MMPRPASKDELLTAIDRERGKLEALLHGLTPERMTQPGVVGEWSVQDVLAHLIEWEQMCQGWYQAGLRGEVPQLPAAGYKWSETPQLNQQIYEKHRGRALEEVLEQSHASFSEIHGVIQALSNEELFTPGHHAWTKKNTLGTYLVSATSSHYLWAWREIRRGLKAKAKQEA